MFRENWYQNRPMQRDDGQIRDYVWFSRCRLEGSSTLISIDVRDVAFFLAMQNLVWSIIRRL